MTSKATAKKRIPTRSQTASTSGARPVQKASTTSGARPVQKESNALGSTSLHRLRSGKRIGVAVSGSATAGAKKPKQMPVQVVSRFVYLISMCLTESLYCTFVYLTASLYCTFVFDWSVL